MIAQVRRFFNRPAIRHIEVLERFNYLQEALMAKIDLLRQAIAENAAATDAAIERVAAKIAELGEPDPDLTQDIETIKASTAQLQTIASSATADPGDDAYVPGPFEGGAETISPWSEVEPVATDEASGTAPETNPQVRESPVPAELEDPVPAEESTEDAIK